MAQEYNIKRMISLVDTHAHLDVEDFSDDLQQVVQRAKEAGVGRMFLPAIDQSSVQSILTLCKQYPNVLYPMLGLHPEGVDANYKEVLKDMKSYLNSESNFIAIGEVGLDFYWSREFGKEQLEAFEEQLKWSIETGLPLMIHCRKAQNEMVKLMKPYAKELPGGVFHCFTGNELEAESFLQFSNFSLGIGGVLTFKKSHLPEVLPKAVPLNRIVLETDSPYMAPVPHRGKRNESAFVVEVAQKLAESYGVSIDEIARQTNENVERIFKIKV